MIVNIWLMCKYYITAMILNYHFSKDKGLTILLISHFENAVKMVHIKHKLGAVQYNPRISDSMVIPTIPQLRQLMRNKNLATYAYDIDMITDALLFYYQVNDSQNLTVEEIAADPISPRYVPEDAFGTSAATEDGRKVDRFGMVNVNLKSIEFFATQMLSEKPPSSEEYIKCMTTEFFDKTIKDFGDFRISYRDRKFELVEKALKTLNDTKSKLGRNKKRIRDRGYSDAERFAEVKIENDKIEELKKMHDKEKNEFDLIGPGQTYDFSGKDEENIKLYTAFLSEASKVQLRLLNYDTDSFLFKHHVTVHVASSTNAVDLPTTDEGLFRMYDEFLKHELERKTKDRHAALPKYLDDFYLEFEEVREEEVDGLVENEALLTSKLDKIDDHTFSAKSIATRAGGRGFVYGEEKAKYPISLVRMIIQKDKRPLLDQLMTNYAHGMRSIFAKDNDNIFRAAFSTYKLGNKHFLPKLAQYKFEFTPDQKKILFRYIISNDDADLFSELVNRHQAIDLYEYQKDRGISFFQSLLIEAGEYTSINSRISLVNANINQKIRFIPEDLPIDTEADTDAIHWHPFYNNFRYTFDGIVIKKGWDNLTIAAVTNNMTMFSMLLQDHTDTRLCQKVLRSLKHDRARVMQLSLDAHYMNS